MKKFTFILFFSVLTFWSYGQFKVHGIWWVDWNSEPDYAETPYENPQVTVKKAPATWTPINSVASFDATWDILGDAHNLAKPTNVSGGDLFDLDGDATFGASWKAVHDGQNLYVLLKYLDTNAVADDGTMTFEVMAQPTSPIRHEPTFVAAADSTADNTASEADLTKIYKNMAYARSVYLGGGKALFKDGLVNEYAASIGLVKNAWHNFYSGDWGANEAGLEAFLDADHFWDKTDGVIKAVLVMSLDGVLSYPENPNNLDSPRKALQIGETFAFDIKSNAKKDDENIEYFWSSNNNNGYASNYYSGHLTLSNDIVTSTRNLKAQQDTRVYMHNGILHVKGGQPVDLEVYSVLGARLKSAKNVSRLSMQDMQNGIYLIRINNEREATKVVKY